MFKEHTETIRNYLESEVSPHLRVNKTVITASWELAKERALCQRQSTLLLRMTAVASAFGLFSSAPHAPQVPQRQCKGLMMDACTGGRLLQE